MPNQAKNTTSSEDVTVDEFIVHTKHTCDSCYIRPIVGKRYTSEAMKDFDLCSRCFGWCEDEKRGDFSETLLARDKAIKNTFILKLKIENGKDDAQTRRINVSDLWNPSVSELSFNKLMNIAGDFAFPEIDRKDDASVFDPTKAKVTYIDEDGDKVNISSDGELMDSFIQTIKKQPFRPFRITVTAAGAKAHVLAANGANNKPNLAPIALHAQVRHGGRCGRRNLTLKKLKNIEKLITSHTDIAQGAIEEEMERTPAFIHARHTCDLCNRTPIIGVRFHSTKVPNFDICKGCHEKYEGEDLGFVPEILARDIQMQGRWLKKHLMMLSSQKELAELLEGSRQVVEGGKRVKSSKPVKMEVEKAEQVTGHEHHDLHLKESNVSTDVRGGKSAPAKVHVEKETLSDTDTPAPAPFFIHARHTCDGCSITPIIGTRYRATKIPDFDLCEACYKRYEGEDLDFKPETLDIDCRMQPRWLRKQVSRARKSEGMASLISLLEQQAKIVTAAAHSVTSLKQKDDDKAETKSVNAKDAYVDTDANDLKNTEAHNANHADGISTEAEGNKNVNSPKATEHDESFLSDAEGHGSIAEVIGRTLDVCVQAIEEVLDNEVDQIKHIDGKDVVEISSAVTDTYSVGSSMISSVTDVLKKLDDSKFSKEILVSNVSADAGETILNSVDDSHIANTGNSVHSDQESVGLDDWSVIGDKKDGKNEFAGAAEVIGSFL